MKSPLLSRLLLWLVLVAPGVGALGQESGSSALASGTIDEIMQNDGYIIIDGQRIEFRQPDVVITYDNQEVRASFLAKGQRIEYRTRADGSISMITLLGPLGELNEIYNQ